MFKTAKAKIKAAALNRETATRADQILAELRIRPGQRVADLGSGGGYFAFRLAELVGATGSVYAVDVDEELLEQLRKEARAREIDNMSFFRARTDSSTLPKRSVDLIFIKDAYHHLSDRVRYFQSLAETVRAGGRVAVIDYIPRWWRFGHCSRPETIRREMRAAGYELKTDHEFLPGQSFMIFGVAPGISGSI